MYKSPKTPKLPYLPGAGGGYQRSRRWHQWPLSRDHPVRRGNRVSEADGNVPDQYWSSSLPAGRQSTSV